jgi:hypothetical protein
MSRVSVSSRGLAAAAFGLLAISTTASADDRSCREIASAAADSWANGRIIAVGPADMAGPDEITVIAYGKKYIMPRRTRDDGEVFTTGLGALTQERNQVYTEELVRCLHPHTVRFKVVVK